MELPIKLVGITLNFNAQNSNNEKNFALKLKLSAHQANTIIVVVCSNVF